MLRVDRLSKLDFTNQPAVEANPGSPVDGLDPDDGLVGAVGEEAEVQPDSEPHQEQHHEQADQHGAAESVERKNKVREWRVRELELEQ